MSLLMGLFLTLNAAQAFDVVDASVLCDRYISGPEQQQCMKFVKEKKPDTYVSSICHYLFDDKIFNDCLKLAIRVSVNPKELSLCGDSEMADKDRLNCIQKRARGGKEYQRLPASFSKANLKSKTFEGKPSSSKPASSSGTKEYPESKAGL